MRVSGLFLCVNYITIKNNCITYTNLKQLTFIEQKFICHNHKKMNREQLKEEWKIQKSKLLKKFSVLTEDDLFFREGQKDQMLERLQLILGKNKEELIMVFDAINPKRLRA